jgi:hypothetical protein
VRIRRWLDASRKLLLAVPSALAVVLLAAGGALGACEHPVDSGTGGGTSTNGEGGCPLRPEPMLTIAVRALDGPVPRDTTIRITWSAGEEPAFTLSDPSTWKTLDEANIVCAVDRTMPPPSTLGALTCQLWTTGATLVQISARGYSDYENTLIPEPSEACDGFVPTQVDIDLLRPLDGGSE